MSLNAVAQALSIAEEADAQLTLLHVLEIPPELTHQPQAPDFDVARIRAEAEFDLTFFGSNSKDIIRQAHCPVLTVPLSRRHRSLKVA